MNVISFPELQITALKNEDLARASEFLYTNYQQLYQSTLPQEVLAQNSPEYFLTYLEKKIGIAWLARIDKRIIGLITVSSNCIEDLWIEKKFRRRKLGSKLVEIAMQHFASKGFCAAQAGVESFNMPARHFFETIGFSKIGAEYFTAATSDYVQAIVFSKSIPATMSRSNGSHA